MIMPKEKKEIQKSDNVGERMFHNTIMVCFFIAICAIMIFFILTIRLVAFFYSCPILWFLY